MKDSGTEDDDEGVRLIAFNAGEEVGFCPSGVEVADLGSFTASERIAEYFAFQ